MANKRRVNFPLPYIVELIILNRFYSFYSTINREKSLYRVMYVGLNLVILL